MRDAFISYSTIDSADAYSVRNFLQRNGCTCWMAPDDIAAGSDYAEAIPRAITDCRTFVLIFSPDAQNSTWVRKEVDKALDKGKTVIPFMLRNFKLNDTFDFLLGNAQWCYAYSDRDAALKKLLDAVKDQQGSYRYIPNAAATPPKQTTTTPKAAYTAPKSTVKTAKPRSITRKSMDSKVISRILNIFTAWGAFWSVTGLLAALSYFLSLHTAMGSGAFSIMGIGMLISLILLIKVCKNGLIDDAISAVQQGNFVLKFLLWLVISVGILVLFVIIGGLTYLEVNGYDSFTPVEMTYLAAASGILSLAMVIGWLKKYCF